MELNTLTSVVDHIASLTPCNPLDIAKAKLNDATAKYNDLKSQYDTAKASQKKAFTALLSKANEANRTAAVKAQKALDDIEAQFNAAKDTAAQLTLDVAKLEKTEKPTSVSGSDKIQLGCAYCAANGIKWEQQELINIARKYTGKDTIGQYGYFVRICKLAKLFGITVTVKLPTAN